jgi:DNA-3-methyladenine glycosylase I
MPPVPEPIRCPWPGDDPLMQAYHDTEWGVPCHDERTLFEFLALEAAQAGLSWRTVLARRAGYQRAFAGFDPAAVAAFDEADVERLMADPGIIRNRLKVRATIANAQRFLAVAGEFGSFDAYLWGFVGGAPLPRPATLRMEDIPATTPLSDALSKGLRARGFAFVGSTIVYAFMQAVGIVNDHVDGCWRTADGHRTVTKGAGRPHVGPYDE